MCSTTLLPDPAALRLDCARTADDEITLLVRTVQVESFCPRCGVSSFGVHSRYTRCIRDLPWNGVAVRLQLLTRRFFCRNSQCRQIIFTERLPGIVARYGRKTGRLEESLLLIGYVVGGEAGAKLAVELGFSVSPDTLLRRVRQASGPPSSGAVRVLGVDDWAFRKGHRYGTILVDLERRCVLDLLADRSSESLAAWLRAHPGIEVITRDRGSDYAQGARDGAPEAVQVADRWHLLKNVAVCLERLLACEHQHVTEAAKEADRSLEETTGKRPAELIRGRDPAALPAALNAPMSNAERDRLRRRERRLSRYQRVIELSGQGMSERSIAKELGINRATVGKYICAGRFPEHSRRRSGRTQLTRFCSYMQKRWDEGCQNATQLYREIKEQGFTGSLSRVQIVVAPWRTWQCEQRFNTISARPPPRKSHPSPRSAAWMLLKEEACDLSEREKNSVSFRGVFLQKLKEFCPAIAAAQKLGRQFFQIVKERRSADLENWFALVAESKVQVLESFAATLKQDYQAVAAGIAQEWSNGQVEGQINRLKLVKRQMYGRAGFDLLKAKVLNSATRA